MTGPDSLMIEEEKNQRALEQYYRFHSKIYDLSRWSFLFGREALVSRLASNYTPKRILEIGCGTGKNLKLLAQAYPDAEMIGLDLSTDMLDVARKTMRPYGDRTSFIQQRYDQPLSQTGTAPFDLILCSYSLTMINPGWDTVIDSSVQDLADQGILAVVDFHDSRFDWFKRWMGVNHVKMDSHLQPKLEGLTKPDVSEVKSAYGFVWDYLLYIGRLVDGNGQGSVNRSG